MEDSIWIARARDYFIDERNLYGCAETVFIVLKEAYNLPNPTDSAAAMVLNGGVAHSGGICGALSGAALAVGMLGESQIPDHILAKRVARGVIAELMDQFQAEFGAVACRDLIGLNLRDEEQHRQFIQSGVWRNSCMSQIEMVIRALIPLQSELAWQRWFNRP